LQPEELIWSIIGFILTVMVLSYLIGDNPLFRFTVHLLIGAGAGYLVVIVIYQVFYTRVALPLLTGSNLIRGLTIIPIVLGLLVFAKLSRRLSRIGNISIAFILGAGTAVVIGGVILGTLIPQTIATFSLFTMNRSSSTVLGRFLEGVFILLGTVTTLGMFLYGTRSASGKTTGLPIWQKTLIKVGQTFLMITMGALFAGLYTAAITALVDRVMSFWHLLTGIF
jgi:hypothetical protein